MKGFVTHLLAAMVGGSIGVIAMALLIASKEEYEWN